MNTTTSPRSVAAFIDQQIDWTQKTTATIAAEAGFHNANVISMIRKGKTKLPISRVKGMAKALGVDPLFLFQMTLREYEPSLLAVIESLTHLPTLTGACYEIGSAAKTTAFADRDSLTDEQRQKLIAFLQTL